MSDLDRRKFLKGAALAGAGAAIPAPPAQFPMSVKGRIVYPGTNGAGVAGASIEIVDLDTGGDGNDSLWSATTDAQGAFGGFIVGWDDSSKETDVSRLYGSSFPAATETVDIPLFKAVVRQGGYVQEFSLPTLTAGENALPPMVVRWNPKVTISLPQLDSPVRTAGECAQAMELKKTYQWDHTTLPPLAFCQGVPAQENPPLGYLPGRIQDALQAKANTLIVRQIYKDKPFGTSIDDYKNQYKVLPNPVVIPTYKEDQEFAAQRLRGINPVMLTRVTQLPADFPVTDDHLRPFFPRPNPLRTALSDNRAFLLDYSILAPINRFDGRRYLPAPYALFLASDDRSRLIPVAIQIERGHDPVSNPVYTPMSTPAQWARAKLMVQVADGSTHEMRFHLYNGHFAMEPVAVAMARNLCVNHPLKLLLNRHFQIMIWNNDLGRRTLINPGGTADTLLGTGLTGSVAIIKQAHDLWRFDQAGLPADLTLRGMDDPTLSLMDYPYRDDGLLIWGAIRNFVQEYVKIYGYDDLAVQQDSELQAWLAETASPDGGNLFGIPTVNSLNALIEWVTQLIYTCSAFHSAVNYPQFDYFGFAPNMPGAAYARPLPAPRGTDETDELKFLPPLQEATDQVEMLASLSDYQYDQLGHYKSEIGRPSGSFIDPNMPDPRAVQAETAAENFRRALNLVGQQIDTRNATRQLKYTRLHPDYILNSISI